MVVKGLMVVPLNYMLIKDGKKTQKRQVIEYKEAGKKVILPSHMKLIGVENGEYVFRDFDGSEVKVVPPHQVGEYLYLKNDMRMPKYIAEVFLKVTGISVEHVHDICDPDIVKEGIPSKWPMFPIYCPICKGTGVRLATRCSCCDTPYRRFRNYWNEKQWYKHDPLREWDANPWVWVISYEKVPPLEWKDNNWVDPSDKI